MLPLLIRDRAQLMESSRHRSSPVLRQASELSRRAANLLPLLGRQPLHRLRPCDRLLSPLRSHVVQLCQPVSHMLLNLRTKLLESGFTLQRPLLLLQRQVAVVIHPLAQVLARIANAGTVRTLNRSLQRLVVGWTHSRLPRVTRRRDVMLLRLLSLGS